MLVVRTIGKADFVRKSNAIDDASVGMCYRSPRKSFSRVASGHYIDFEGVTYDAMIT